MRVTCCSAEYVNTSCQFYRAMLRRARYCQGKSSICLSIHVVQLQRSHRLELIENIFMTDQRRFFSLPAERTSQIYSKENSRNFGRTRGRVWKKVYFLRTKALTSLKRDKIGPRLLLKTIGSRIYVISKSTTLDMAVEVSLYTLFQNTQALRRSVIYLYCIQHSYLLYALNVHRMFNFMLARPMLLPP